VPILQQPDPRKARKCSEFLDSGEWAIQDSNLGPLPYQENLLSPPVPTGEKARAVKALYQGVCRGCGADTQPRNGKGDAYAHCKACHPGAIQMGWTRQRVLAAMREWRGLYGRLPSSYDWSRTYARKRGGGAQERLAAGEWPAASVVTDLFGTWAAARASASREDVEIPTLTRATARRIADGATFGCDDVAIGIPVRI
jgi:hypothetical protein